MSSFARDGAGRHLLAMTQVVAEAQASLCLGAKSSVGMARRATSRFEADVRG
jgi:hypothetical protein